MARFKITWASGLETEYEQSDCHTVEQFVNCRFGAGAKLTAKVELVGEKVEVAPEPKAAKPTAPEPVAKPKVAKPAK
jgi:hypothetical protein